MTTFVLFHGAWGGSFGFRRVRRLLQEQGHEVFTPSLTGIGERVHLASPQVSLSTHIQDVVNCVLYEDLDDLVLLGFSYGGMVVTGALEYIGDRIRHLVYLDAFLPEHGESLVNLPGQGEGRVRHELGQPWLVPPMTPSGQRAIENPQWWEVRRTPHPVGCFVEAVHLEQPLDNNGFERTYIKATGEPRPEGGGPFWSAADRVKDAPQWHYHEIATDHLIPMKRPEELCALLVDLA